MIEKAYKLIEKAYKLIGTSEEKLLENLSEWICEVLEDEKKNVFYFSLPFWDYTKNHWAPNTQVCFNLDNETDNDLKNIPVSPDFDFKDENNWRKYASKKNKKLTTYDTFFGEALKKSNDFSFVGFLTQKVKKYIPILSIETSGSGSDSIFSWDDNKNTLVFKVSHSNNIEGESQFIERVKEILKANLDLNDSEKTKELSGFYKFLRVYQEHFGDNLFIYLITSKLFANAKGESVESGGIVLVCKEHVEDKTLQLLSVVSNLCYRELGAKNWQDKCTKEAIKSAIAAIMSRNMSHNLGSHYLYYTKSQLLALANSLEEKGPEIRGAAKVLGYMQARMDYLATIVAGEKYPYGSVYFKGQMFDELTIDDFSKRHFDIKNDINRKYKRTTNYLLQNIILSENFTRPSIYSDCSTNSAENNKNDFTTETEVQRVTGLNTLFGIAERYFCKKPIIDNSNQSSDIENPEIQTEKNDNKTIRLQILIGESILSECSYRERLFTGLLDNEDIEKSVKLGISKTCIALPGGIMSIHAFYNVVENLIRNSAKYRKEDFKDKDLVFTIAIDELKEKTIKGKQLPTRYRFIIYDNKSNANKKVNVLNASGNNNEKSLLDIMNEKLSCIKILNKNNELDKGDKGLKEMLFSTIWMRTYTYEESKDLSDILLEIDSKSGQDKMDEINNHGFKYVAVDKEGKESGEIDANLGICFELPKYKTVEYIGEICSEDELIKKGLNNFRDIVCVKPGSKMTVSRKDGGPDYELVKVFTRLYDNDGKNQSEVEIFKSILDKRFDNIDKFKISIEKEEKGFCNKTGILFITHLGLDSDQKKDHLKKMKNHFYSEAISGENFTKTMQDLLLSGMNHNGVFNKETEYFALKVKETALTRITLIDERFYKEMIAHSTLPKDENPLSRDFVYKCKNIRILTLNDMDINNQLDENKVFASNHELVKNAFVGNEFKDDKDHTHFLSIHLGMIEKIVKDEQWCKVFKIKGKDIGERAKHLLEELKKIFKSNKEEIFISIHSGRGNFSKELEESLKNYPFISVSALDAALSNCKFLLAQLFYNTVYIGKGLANESN